MRAMALCFVACAGLCHAAARGEVSFQSMGILPGGAYSHALSLAADGTTLVGESYDNHWGHAPVQWRGGSLSVLRTFQPITEYQLGEAFAVSGDGSIAAGIAASGSYIPCTWVNGQYSALPATPVALRLPIASGISADGSTVIGYGTLDSQSRAVSVVWRGGAATQLPGPATGSIYANDVNGDGSVIVGQAHNTSGFEGARWTNGGAPQFLGDLAGGSDYSAAHGVSLDGQTVVGESYSASGREAFRWQNGVMIGLGDVPFPGGMFDSVATAVSGDGSVVVGWGTRFNGPTWTDAFIWDATKGARLLSDVLTGDYGLDLTGWTLSQATDISTDGRTISGWGVAPDGRETGWIVHVPSPGAPAVLLAALSATLGGRRRRAR